MTAEAVIFSFLKYAHCSEFLAYGYADVKESTFVGNYSVAILGILQNFYAKRTEAMARLLVKAQIPLGFESVRRKYLVVGKSFPYPCYVTWVREERSNFDNIGNYCACRGELAGAASVEHYVADSVAVD